jgi:hypothetical protein
LVSGGAGEEGASLRSSLFPAVPWPVADGSVSSATGILTNSAGAEKGQLIPT